MATMPSQQIAAHAEAFATTQRVDRWWIAPLTTAAGLVLFFGYLTVRAFIPNYVWYPPYISPTVAPPLFTPAAGAVAHVVAQVDAIRLCKLFNRTTLYKGSQATKLRTENFRSLGSELTTNGL
jgi:hypothetical protein